MPERIAAAHASPYLLLTLTAFFWSFNWVVGRGLVGQVSPMALTFLRWCVAVAVMLPFAWPLIREHRAALARNWRLVVRLGFWGTGLHNLFAYVGLQWTTATNGVILNSAIPIWIILLGWLAYRDTVTRLQVLGIVICIAGVFAILTGGDPAVLLALTLNKGDVIVLLGMVFWAAYTVYQREKPAELPGLAVLACCACVGVLLLLPLFAIEMMFFEGVVNLTPVTIGALAYVGIFPSFVGYVFWNRAVAEVGPNVAGNFLYLMPAFGSLLAWIFLGESIRAYHVAGIGLILAGITLTTRGRRAVPEPGPE